MSGKRPLPDDHDETNSSRPSQRRLRLLHHDPNSANHEPGSGLSSPPHDDYTIAWICALHIEMGAAWAMLDKVYEPLATRPNDTNTYILGTIGPHNVVIACLPDGHYGTNNAANVLTNLLGTFKSVRLGLMVGIGGGAPSVADIRLGDIVVGSRVMQYDLGKIVKDGEIQRIATPKIPSQLLGTAVSTLRARHQLEPSRTPSILQEKLGEHPTYSRPSAPDRLFAATYEHDSPVSSCDRCDQSRLVPRRRRTSDNPVIHYGGIASSNQVMRNSTTRDNIARELDVMCFEMEAAGLMDVLACLPIRGICDYSDSHKSKEWQSYTAATAAAYARELLEVLPTVGAHKKTPSIPASRQDFDNDRRESLLEALRFKQIYSRKITIKSTHPKTCRWFLTHPAYEAWLDPSRLAEHNGFLWIRGKPGVGKSTMMKFIYSQEKKKTQGVTASFFFNARGDILEKSVSGMYRSLLLQLLEAYPDLQIVLDDPDLIPPHQSDCPPLNVLKDLFCNAVVRLGQLQFTCFVDALDECDEQQVRSMIQDFEDLAEQSIGHGISLRICFSSRHYPYINVQQGIQLVLEDQPGHDVDLANYVEARLQTKESAFTQRLLHKSSGIFLWTVLVVDILNEEVAWGQLALEKKLEEIPSNLGDLFKNMLMRDQKNSEYLLLCILWILCAESSLSPEEYYHALWSGLSLQGLVDSEAPDISSINNGNVEKLVISSSKGLAEITSLHTVQFIHESVRDFLIKDKGLQYLWPDMGFDWASLAHERLKQCCSVYINLTGVRASISKLLSEDSGVKRMEISRRYPFLNYASRHVLRHADVAAVTVPQDEFLTSFHVSDWVNTINTFESPRYSPGASLLYVLAGEGLSELICARLERDARIDIRGQTHEYPLFAALVNGHEKAAVSLLKPSSVYNSESIGHRGRHGRTPLLLASEEGYEMVTRLLLDKGADVNARDDIGGTPLFKASESNHEAVVRLLLLSKNIDVNLAHAFGWTPLWCAAFSGHEAIVKLLLAAKGVNVNFAENQYGWSPLHIAAAHRHEAVVRLLIEAGANKETKDNRGRTPLHMAASRDGDVGTNIESEKPRRFLKMSSPSAARSLIEAGADYEARDNDDCTPLHLAARSRYKAIVRLLVKAGADKEAGDSANRTPLQIAKKAGRDDVVSQPE